MLESGCYMDIPGFHIPSGKKVGWWSLADVRSYDDTHGSCSSSCCICREKNKKQWGRRYMCRKKSI